MASALLLCQAVVTLSGVAGVQSEHEELRQRLGQSLAEMSAGTSAFQLGYSTFEVLSRSELGDLVSPLFDPTSARALNSNSVVESLAVAARATKKTPSQQLTDIRSGGVPEHARAAGLLVGGEPMTFDVVEGETRYMQSCISDPSYFSVVRCGDIDLMYFSAESRLAIATPNEGMLLFSRKNMYFPLPTVSPHVSAFVAWDWDVTTLTPRETQIKISGGSNKSSVTTLVVGGPTGTTPLYCARTASGADIQYVMAALFTWKFVGQSAELESVLFGQQSPESINLAFYHFGNRRMNATDGDCVLVVKEPVSITDNRTEPPRSLVRADLPANVAKLLEFMK